MTLRISIVFIVFIGFMYSGWAQDIAENKNEDFWKKGIVEEGFIYDTAPFPSVHSPTIVETPTGLLAAFFGGEYEGHPEVCIYTSKRLQSGWTEPAKIADGIVNDTLRKACYNPVLFQYPDGELLLFYKIGKNVQDWTGYLIRSFDDGLTWTKPEALPQGFLGAIKNKPELIGETLICPSSTEGNGWQVHFELTNDRGKTWTKTANVKSKPWNIIQPAILKLKDAKLQVVCRSQDEHIISAFSSDNGRTWSDPVALYLPNNNSGIDAVTLKDGRHLLVYNHVKTTNSAYVEKARTPLNVAISDDGITWKASLVLENSPIKEYSYPSVIQGKDGMVHIVYTWRREKIKYIKIDPDQLNALKFINGEWPLK